MRLKFGSFVASLWATAFLRNCRKVFAPLIAVNPVEARIRQRAQTLFDEELVSLPDKKGRLILAMCSLVLAAFEELKSQAIQPALAFDAVRRAFAVTYPAPMTWSVRVWLWFHRDPVRNLQRRPRMADQGRRMYGKSMEFAEEYTEDCADMLITRCAYHEFFVKHGAADLTLLVCAWDRAWMDAVDRSVRPVRTERPSTISTGGECCRFRFVRDALKAKQSPQDHDVVLIQLSSVHRKPS